MMDSIFVFKAGRIGLHSVDSKAIVMTLSVDDFAHDRGGDAVLEEMNEQARDVVRLMMRTMPQGLTDRILAELLRHKASGLLTAEDRHDGNPAEEACND